MDEYTEGDFVAELAYLAYDESIPELTRMSAQWALDKITGFRLVIAERLTPEDLGMVKVNANDKLAWPWWRFPDTTGPRDSL